MSITIYFKPIPLGYCKKWFTLDMDIFHMFAICNNMKVTKRNKFNILIKTSKFVTSEEDKKPMHIRFQAHKC